MFNSRANGPAAHEKAAQGRTANRARLHRNHRQPDVKQGGAAGYLREGGACHINAEPSPVGPPLQ